MAEITDVKPWYQSRAVWGSLVAIIAPLGMLVGLEIDSGFQVSLVDFLVLAGSAVGGAVALWGRLKATKTIGK